MSSTRRPRSARRLLAAARHHFDAGGDGRLVTLFAGPKHRSVTIREALPFDGYRATVAAQGGPNLLPGHPARARLRAIRAAKLELLRCKHAVCTAKAVLSRSGPLATTSREVHATLGRGGKVFGNGIASGLHKPSQISLNQRRRLVKGRYTLLLSYGHGGRRHTARATIRIG